jgi:hypothetical protein
MKKKAQKGEIMKNNDKNVKSFERAKKTKEKKLLNWEIAIRRCSEECSQHFVQQQDKNE